MKGKENKQNNHLDKTTVKIELQRGDVHVFNVVAHDYSINCKDNSCNQSKDNGVKQKLGLACLHLRCKYFLSVIRLAYTD